MKDVRIGINLELGFDDVPMRERPAILSACGYSSCFTGWEDGCRIKEWAAAIERGGLEYQSVHAPFDKVDLLWENDGSEGDAYLEKLIRCVQDCAGVGVGIMIVHTIIGMNRHTPTELGLKRYASLIRAAETYGVALAFENTEGVEYLQAVMDAFKDSEACRFCWDTGHEMCYNHGEDMMARFGDRLIATHLNDNVGMEDPKTMTWLDDSHMLPFDGKADWKGIASRLNRHGYQGIHTLEVFQNDKPGKHTHDAYRAWSYEEFVTQALERARRLVALRDDVTCK